MTLGTTYTRTSPIGDTTVVTIKNDEYRDYHLDLQQKGFKYTPCGQVEVTDPFGDGTIKVHRTKDLVECESCSA